MTWSPFGLQLLFSNFKLRKSLGRHHVWEGLLSEAVWGFLCSPCSFTELCFSKADPGLSLLSLQWHLLTLSPSGDLTNTQGPPSALCRIARVAAIFFRAYQQFLCNRPLLQKLHKAAENNHVDLCASEVKTWEYTFDLMLLCNLNLFLLLTLLSYYQKNGYNLQRYTTIWIWMYWNDMVCLWTVMNSYNDRITQIEHSCVTQRLLS